MKASERLTLNESLIILCYFVSIMSLNSVNSTYSLPSVSKDLNGVRCS